MGTVRRIDSLLDRMGLNRDDVLRVEGVGGPSYASGVAVEEVRELLRGERSAEPGPGVYVVEALHRRVVERILFLRATRLRAAEDGSRRAYSIAEIAYGAGTSAQWLDKMIKTGRVPNLDHAAGIVAFFGEDRVPGRRAGRSARWTASCRRSTRTCWSGPWSARTRICGT